jgi:hypothetical protein
MSSVFIFKNDFQTRLVLIVSSLARTPPTRARWSSTMATRRLSLALLVHGFMVDVFLPASALDNGVHASLIPSPPALLPPHTLPPPPPPLPLSQSNSHHRRRHRHRHCHVTRTWTHATDGVQHMERVSKNLVRIRTRPRSCTRRAPCTFGRPSPFVHASLIPSPPALLPPHALPPPPPPLPLS